MSGSTANQGFPYPDTADFADVQDAFRLAIAVDSEIRSQQAPMRTFMSRPSFIARQTVTGSGFISGTQSMDTDVIDWDNTGGMTVGFSGWRQPFAAPPSWWMFGTQIFVSNTGGPVLGEGIMGKLDIETTDQVTGVATSTAYYQRVDESNTSGDWVNLFAFAPVFRGFVTPQLILDGSTTKAIQAGSRFWGIQLGPVT
jgi:hypothetical protein